MNDMSPQPSAPFVVEAEPLQPLFSTSVELDPASLEMLVQQGFPLGLAKELKRSKAAHPIRYWILDNSGSMRTTDGRRLIGNRDSVMAVACSRWTELQQTVEYHAQLAGLLHSLTVFRTLNPPTTGSVPGSQEFSVASTPDPSIMEGQVETALEIIRKLEPYGVTPLTQHMDEIYQRIKLMEDSLRSQGQRAVLVVATDGLPSDDYGNSSDAVNKLFVDSIRRLQTLPVWIVIRLCTNDDSVVDFYNNLESDLESPLEVIDDFFGEGQEIHKANPWLTYGLSLHRCREMGYHHRVFDMLDEKLLGKDEFLEVLRLLFGEELAHAPDIHLNWTGFRSFLSNVIHKQGKTWDPVSRKMQFWVDLKKVDRYYGSRHGVCCTM